ncbi:MAG: DUF4375 domain-containing protein [Pseudomonadota bacterium]
MQEAANIYKPKVSAETLSSIDDLLDEVLYKIGEADNPRTSVEDIKLLLNTSQLVVFAVCECEREVLNGGFDQYFFNSYGRWGPEAVEGFERLGLRELSQIVREAISVFPDVETIREPSLRETFLGHSEQRTLENVFSVFSNKSRKIAKTFDRLDEAFAERQEEISERLHPFVLENLSSLAVISKQGLHS